MVSTTTDRLAGVTAGLSSKAPVRAATTANITLSGEQTIDGVAVVADDRVLVKDQTDGIENGIYDAKSGAWVRSLDFDGTRDVVSGTFVVVASGSAGAGTVRRLSTADPITIGTTSLTFTLMAIDGGTVSTFMATVLDDTTALAARTTLGTMEIVNVVADHGAVGDGVADDTVAIQAASDAGTDKTIFFPDGTYIVTGIIITVRQNWKLSPGAVLKLKDSTNTTVVTVSAARCVIEGGKIDGNKANQTTPCNGIFLNADNCRVTGTEIRDAETYGLLARNVIHPVFDKCEVYDSDDIGIFVEVTTGASKEGCSITHCLVDRLAVGVGITEGGIKVHGDNSALSVFRSKIIGNYVLMPTNPTDATAICIEVFGFAPYSSIQGNTTSGGNMGISVAKSDGTAVEGNTIFNPKDLGIELALSDNCTVSGNTMDGNALGNKGISVSNTNPSHNAIVGNSIRGFTERGIQVTDGLQITITGNVVFVGTAPGYAIEVLDSAHIIVAGNMLHGDANGERGVVLNKTDRSVISGNGIFNFSAFGVVLVAASAFTFTNVIISGNNLNTTTVPIGTSLSGGGALGAEIRAIGNTGLVRNAFKMDILDLLNDIIEITGTSSPNTVVTAGIGSFFHRTDVAPALYVKTSGTGNTTWDDVLIV